MLKDIIEKQGFKYVEITGESYQKILNLFQQDVILVPKDSIEAFYFGLYYLNKNEKDAKKYFKSSILMGNTDSIKYLAKIYLDANNMTKAVYMYKKLLDIGDIDAPYILGSIYLGRYKDGARATNYLKIGIELGCSRCMNKLGLILSDIDYVEAENMYKLAITNGSIISNYNLAHLYEKNGNYSEALSYYLKSPTSMHLLSMKAIIGIYKKLGKCEEALLFSIERKLEIDNVELFNQLTYPVSDQNKIKIYNILETYQFGNCYLSSNLFKILQDAIMHKQKLLTTIAYYGKYLAIKNF